MKNIPNQITISRVLLIFVFVLFSGVDSVNPNCFRVSEKTAYICHFLAIVVAFVAALTDLLDGYLARKMKVESDQITVSSNSETADYEAEMPCITQGSGLTIAFNQKYIMNTMGVIGDDTAVMKFNSSLSPCVIQAKGSDGIHLTLPVRIAG